MLKNTQTRRAANRTLTRGGVLAAVIALTPLTPLTSLTVAPAVAAPAQTQQAYDCTITVDENPGQPSQMDLTVKMNLNLPDQVTAGEEFTVDGDFSVQLPSELGTLMGAYFPSARLTSDGLMLPVTIGGEEQLVSTSYIDSGKIDTRNPPVVFGGDFTTDPIQVPENAEGEVGVTMPRNDSVPAISRDGKAAITAILAAEGGLVPGYDKGTDRVSCNTKGEPSQIGTVPIVAGQDGADGAGQGASAAAGDGADGAGGADSANSGNSGNDAAAAPRTNRVADAQGAGDDGEERDEEREGEEDAASDGENAAASAEQAAAMREMSDQMRLASMNEAASREDGSYVSIGTIALGTLGVVVASVLFTVAMNTRTRRLERAAEDFD
ncbi:MAG TPA: hypothetical protein H9870_11200 [Candidatus Corynebacterium avicola]|uniref:SDR-like Ig domain-containing protein n=1 Tax=Candidatus Corynebacterium avicola TaxID=2838527 RepID=A0A9D1RS05_9CORY|nr:hypothetical protein [Candidatus Corynebacterium avicola]